VDDIWPGMEAASGSTAWAVPSGRTMPLACATARHSCTMSSIIRGTSSPGLSTIWP